MAPAVLIFSPENWAGSHRAQIHKEKEPGAAARSLAFQRRMDGRQVRGKDAGALLGGGRSARGSLGSLEPASLHVSRSPWEACSVSYLVYRLRITDRCGVNCEKARTPRPRGPCLQGRCRPLLLYLICPPVERMTTHSIILAWRIPWTEEPGGLHPMGLQSQTRVSS